MMKCDSRHNERWHNAHRVICAWDCMCKDSGKPSAGLTSISNVESDNTNGIQLPPTSALLSFELFISPALSDATPIQGPYCALPAHLPCSPQRSSSSLANPDQIDDLHVSQPVGQHDRLLPHSNSAKWIAQLSAQIVPSSFSEGHDLVQRSMAYARRRGNCCVFSLSMTILRTGGSE